MTNMPNVKPVEKSPSQSADRDTYSSGVREKLIKIQSKMTSLKEDAARLGGDLKTKAEDNIAKIDSKYKELKNRADEFKFSTEEKWTADKEIFDKGFQELSNTHKDLLV